MGAPVMTADERRNQLGWRGFVQVMPARHHRNIHTIEQLQTAVGSYRHYLLAFWRLSRHCYDGEVEQRVLGIALRDVATSLPPSMHHGWRAVFGSRVIHVGFPLESTCRN